MYPSPLLLFTSDLSLSFSSADRFDYTKELAKRMAVNAEVIPILKDATMQGKTGAVATVSLPSMASEHRFLQFPFILQISNFYSVSRSLSSLSLLHSLSSFFVCHVEPFLQQRMTSLERFFQRIELTLFVRKSRRRAKAGNVENHFQGRSCVAEGKV